VSMRSFSGLVEDITSTGRTHAVRAADPRSVRGAGRTHAGRAAVARRYLPVVSRRHPGSLDLRPPCAPLSPTPSRVAVPPRRAITAAADELPTLLVLNAVQAFLSLL
jgi:hypothetical protein